MGTAQVIYIIIIGLNLGISLAKHGKYRNDKYNFWVTLIASIIDVAILRWGGFF